MQPALKIGLVSVSFLLVGCSEQIAQQPYCSIKINQFCLNGDETFTVQKQSASEYVLYSILDRNGVLEGSIYLGQFAHAPDLSPILCNPNLNLVEAAEALNAVEVVGDIDDVEMCVGKFLAQYKPNPALTVDVEVVPEN